MINTVQKFVTIGPESTGKSTLCALLAEHYTTTWCPEFARQYLEEKGNQYDYDDLLTIAKGQLNLENDVVQNFIKQHEGKPVFIDTDMHVMRVWCEYVFGNCHPYILNQIAERHYDGYFLCAPDLPWEKDPLREYPDQRLRDELFLFYKELLTAQHIPWIEIRGNHNQRMQMAIDFIHDQTISE